MVKAGATANTTVKNSRAPRESGLLFLHSHGESIGRKAGTWACLQVVVGHVVVAHDALALRLKVLCSY